VRKRSDYWVERSDHEEEEEEEEEINKAESYFPFPHFNSLLTV